MYTDKEVCKVSYEEKEVSSWQISAKAVELHSVMMAVAKETGNPHCLSNQVQIYVAKDPMCMATVLDPVGAAVT